MMDMTIETEGEDLEMVFEYAKGLDYVDKGRFSLVGESMGGFVSAVVGAKIATGLRSMVLWYPAFNIPEDAKKRMAQGSTDPMGIKISPEFDPVVSAINVKDFQSVFTKPVCIIHGNVDKIVPIENSYKALGVYPNAKLHVIDGADHGFDGADSDRARALTIDFLRETC
ncbi:MAG: prolyl oligopeptidase family serine peptidase [Butyrivibrio sp.]|nr:prolyl oligopeptidase family serine peptidase [Butyrivibrio sp.]